MTRPGFEPAPRASEADALTIMLSGPAIVFALNWHSVQRIVYGKVTKPLPCGVGTL